MPRVSVIIPAYNAERHLADALRSVEAQTYGDWEVVVADDASSDATAAIAESFPRIALVRSATNVGPAGARNLAIEQSGGELVALLDSDDTWLPNYLEEQVRIYDKSRDAKVGIIACNARILGADGLEEWTYLERYGIPGEVTLSDLLEFNPIFVGAMVPRAVVNEVGGFSTECFGTEDHDLWIRIVERGYRVVTNPTPLAVYRLGAHDSVSSSLLGMARTTQATYRRALERGNLTPEQERVARCKLRFNRAVEVVVAARTDAGRLDWGRLARSFPLLLSVAVRDPRSWRRWLRVVRSGRLG